MLHSLSFVLIKNQLLATALHKLLRLRLPPVLAAPLELRLLARQLGRTRVTKRPLWR